PRKNGKSTLSGGLAIYLTCADGEPGAQVIAAATTKQQAGYVFTPIRQLAERAPALKGHVKPYRGKIIHPKSGSYFEVIASVADAQHGANLHGAVIDELHVHKDPEMVEVIETGTGSRRQPLIVIITTADSGKPETIYNRKRTRIEQLARGVLEDPSVYGVVWAVPKDADPFVEATWRAANPGFGISPTRSYLER
ncbi:terminase large subunit domain-containing protein, partial [Streptomyces scabiei]